MSYLTPLWGQRLPVTALALSARRLSGLRGLDKATINFTVSLSTQAEPEAESEAEASAAVKSNHKVAFEFDDSCCLVLQI